MQRVGFLICRVGTLSLAVPLTNVIGVSGTTPVTPLPFSPQSIDGLVLAMGYAVVQMTVADRLGLAVDDDGVLVLAAVDGDVRALKVSFVLAMTEVDADIIKPGLLEGGPAHATGSFAWESLEVFILDLTSLWDSDGVAPKIDDIDGAALLALAGRDEPAGGDDDAPPPRNAFVLVETGGERYALRTEEVIELMVVDRVRPMPGAPLWLAGLIDRRGTPTLAIGTRRLLGHGSDITGNLALMVQHRDLGAIALLVDRALGIHYFESGDMHAMSEKTEGVASYLVAGDGLIVGIIDSALLLDQVAGKLIGIIPQLPARPVEHIARPTDDIAHRVLTLRVGRERFAIDLDRIDRILASVTISALPEGGNGFSGMADVGEIPVPVLDLRHRAGDPARHDARHPGAPCALVHLEGAIAGLVVDQVLRIESVPRGRIDPVASDHRLPISGVFEIGGEMVSMLMIDRLLPIMPVH